MKLTANHKSLLYAQYHYGSTCTCSGSHNSSLHHQTAPWHQHDINTSEIITNPPHTRVWKWQTGSILCLAWEQLLEGNRDHESSVSTATLAAALRCSMQGGDQSWADASCSEKAPSAPSSLGWFFIIRLILKMRPGVCDLSVRGQATDHLRALGIKTVWTICGASDIWINTEILLKHFCFPLN